MSAASEFPHLPAVGVSVRREIGLELEATLMELLDLSLLGRQLDWSLTGPSSIALHRGLDQLVGSWRELADTLGRRAVVIGYWPDGQADAIASAPSHTSVGRGPVEDEAAVSLLVQYLLDLVERTRGRLGRLGELDLVSQGLIIRVLGELETQLCLLRGHLGPGG